MNEITPEVLQKVARMLGPDFDYSPGHSRKIGTWEDNGWGSTPNGELLLAILDKSAEMGKHQRVLAAISAHTHGIAKNWKPSFLRAALLAFAELEP